ncbi:hypothetical protein ZK41_001374 [Salmonella enterica subsp. enterica serovar Java]|nr:hypothetical protein [Salmonella enterica subsp. enterica serovar Abony]EDW4638720.1 hypothetical protein [Salmonella enterica subsp. enterica serovar Java]EBZ5844337.1 hypothetical protein [Salmonella enterica subsp. enterica serovar Abony]ECA2014961.1 hypothetical protein [Salmonella enterica subsp. enterica serovar Abony]ECB0329429.1 hypothetical protein [Salmonella enterica subsp. enterica serovar Abony]
MGLLKHYRTDYPNQVHQLTIAVSKHYYAGVDGLLKYQKKVFDIKLSTAGKTGKDHLLIYALRDHCSGLFYIELAFISKPEPVKAFLGRAWRPKEENVLQGLPDMLMVPKTVEEAFPGVCDAVYNQGVDLLRVTSGFQSGGLIAMRAIEERLKFYTNEPIARVREAAEVACRYNATERARTNNETKQEMWLRSVSQIDLPSPDF